jgi:glycosyltransferase involved in cell wall biosynthesis
MSPQLSVVVTVYNLERYIEKCIDSLLLQDYKYMEIVIVDDGSTDNTSEICDKYEKKYNNIRVVHKCNEGVVKALATGIDYSEGLYITFIDGDDWVQHNCYGSLMKLLLDNDLDIITYGAIRYRNENDYYYTYDSFKEGIYEGTDLNDIKSNMIWDKTKQGFQIDPSLCMKIFRKDIIETCVKNVLNIKIHYAQDVIITYPAIKEAEKLGIIHDAYYFHRRREIGVQPAYLMDSQYYYKLYLVYKYLSEIFKFDKNILQQIEAFYQYSVKLRCLDNTQDVTIDKWLFPFDKVKKGSNIIIYGYGKVGKTYIQQLEKLNFCNVICIVDSAYEKYQDNGGKIFPIEHIVNKRYDYIVIANASDDVKHKIKNVLMNNFNVEEKKII